MEPLSILSIAAAAVQFLDFGTRIFADSIETFKSSSGQKQDIVDLSVIANDVKRLTSDMETKLSKFASKDMIGSSQHNGDACQFGDATKNALIRLCRQANEIGDELRILLAKLQAHGKTKLNLAVSSFLTVLKGIWSEERIQDVKNRLDQTQKQIMMETLVLTWDQAIKNHVTMVEFAKEQGGKLDAIDESTRNFGQRITNILERRTDESQLQAQMLRQYVLDSGWQTSEQINDPTWHGNDAVNRYRNTRLARAFTKTLRFQSIDDREKSIPKTYASTYEWIFQSPRPSSDGDLSWSDFSQWLCSTSNEIYWITGKPGAGKSTLIKFIASHEKINALLGKWAGQYSVTLATYYSWNAGTSLQNSHQGLLRALLYQCISHCPDLLVPVVFPRQWALFQLSNNFLKLPEWDMSELVAGFRALLAQTGKRLSDEVPPFRLAIIIDGLDEFDTKDHIALVELLHEASTYPSVKICVSSRPWNVFRDAFHQNPMLQLEKFTRPDIHTYVHSHFHSSPGFRELSILQPHEAGKLLNDILDKAQGVFLWVSVVVRDLLIRFQEGDRLLDLRGTIDELPDDLSNLFHHMWKRTDSQYHGEAAQYFSILKTYHKYGIMPHAIGFWLGDDENPLDLHPNPDNAAFLSSGVSSLKRRLSSRTRGLLDLYPEEDFDTGRVDYLHRTVKEWIDKNWNNIRSTINQDFDPNLWILKGETLRIPVENYYDLDRRPLFTKHVFNLFDVAIDVPETSSNNAKLVRILDRLDAQVTSVVDPQRRSAHWCHGAGYDWSDDSDWKNYCADYQINFTGFMAQAIPRYIKTKIPQDSTIMNTTEPIVSVLLSTILGAVRGHPLNLHPRPWREDILIQLDLVEFVLPFTPLDEVKRILYPPRGHVAVEILEACDVTYLTGLKKLLRANIKARKEKKESIMGLFFSKVEELLS